MIARRAFIPLAIWLGTTFVPPAMALDTVTRKSDPSRPLSGTIISESPRGIRMKIGTTTREIPADDILGARHDFATGSLRREFYTPAFNSGDRIDTAPDRKKAVAEALDHFEKLLGKLKAGDDPRVRRNVEFRIASLLARQAREEGKPPGPAIRKLREFCKNRVDGWQIIPSARLLGRLLTTEKQYRQAEQVYGDLAANPLLPVEARNTCRLLAARVSIRRQRWCYK